jgi:hypothetical protein
MLVGLIDGEGGSGDSRAQDLSTGDHFVHDYNQVKSYKRYFRRVRGYEV